MANARTTVEILNTSLEKVAIVKNLYPLNQKGVVLRYSRELSDYGQCRFRISTKDPVLTQFGDILKPHAYHIRIKRANVVVWQGAIVDNPERNRNYIEVNAYEYLYYLDKILIRRDKDKPATSEDESNFRVFNSGTMASKVSTIISNAATDFNNNHILANMTAGTIENPDYPNNFVKSDGKSKLTGGWNFSEHVVMTFDYHSALYVLKSFGIYSGADFELTNDLQFNFKKLIGDRISGLTFSYAPVGTNIVDYNIPRYGQRQANKIIGIAADEKGKILHSTQNNLKAQSEYGLLEKAEAFSDVKNRNLLDVRLKEELRLISDPEESPINIVLNEKAYPLGQFKLGDILWVRIKDHIIDFQKERRIVGYTINLHNTGREMVVIQTNKPDDKLVGAS